MTGPRRTKMITLSTRKQMAERKQWPGFHNLLYGNAPNDVRPSAEVPPPSGSSTSDQHTCATKPPHGNTWETLRQTIVLAVLLSWEVLFFSRIRHGACHHPWEMYGDLLKSLSPVTFTSFLNFLQKQARTVDLIVAQTVNWNFIPNTVARILNTFWQYLVMSELFKPRDLSWPSCVWPKDICRHQRSS